MLKDKEKNKEIGNKDNSKEIDKESEKIKLTKLKDKL